MDTPEHVRAAWNYIHHQDNAARYDSGEVESIKNRIRRAAKHHEVQVSEE
jgi:hypothetical protein